MEVCVCICVCVCVCVCVGGGVTHPLSLISTDRQEKKKIMWPCGPCRLMPGQER